MPKKGSRKAKKGGCTYGSGVSGAARKRRPSADKAGKSKSKSRSHSRKSRKSHSRKSRK